VQILHNNKYSRGKENIPPPQPSEKSTPTESVTHGLDVRPPAWNISVGRMKVLARVSQLVVHVETVNLNLPLLERLQQRPESGRAGSGKPPYQPAARGGRGLSAGGGGRRLSPPTFCVKFRLPGETEEASLCSRRLAGGVVEFHQRKAVPVIFNSRVSVRVRISTVNCGQRLIQKVYAVFSSAEPELLVSNLILVMRKPRVRSHTGMYDIDRGIFWK
jgi:hypothetical protein